MRDQHLSALKQAILKELGYLRYKARYASPNQDLTEITSAYREWREIVTDALAQYDITAVGVDIDNLVDRHNTIHDLLDYMQRQIDKKEQHP